MLRLFVRLLIWLVIFALGSWLIAQWKLEQDVETIQRKVSPWLDFKYEGVSVSLLGDLKIRNITATTRNSNIAIDVGELSVNVGNIWSALMAKFRLQDKEIPEDTSISLKNIAIPYSDLANYLDSGEEDSSLQIVDALACGPVKRFGPKQNVMMGYGYITMSFSMSTHYDASTGIMAVTGQAKIDDMEQQDFQMNIGGIADWFENESAKEEDAILPGFEFFKQTIVDDGYNLNKAEFCAIKSNKTVDQYLQQHVLELKALLDKVGIHPTEQAINAYADAIKPGAKIEIILQPASSFEWKNIKFYDMQEWQDIGGLMISVNGQQLKVPVPDWNWTSFEKISENRKQEKLQKAQEKRQYDSKVIIREFHAYRLPGYKLAPELEVRISRNDGKKFQGKIRRFDNTTIWLDVKKGSGVLTMPVKRSTISKFEVYE